MQPTGFHYRCHRIAPASEQSPVRARHRGPGHQIRAAAARGILQALRDFQPAPQFGGEIRAHQRLREEDNPFDEGGIRDTCRFAERKASGIDCAAPDRQLRDLCDRHRSTDGSYDCIVPSPGGKDSFYWPRCVCALLVIRNKFVAKDYVSSSLASCYFYSRTSLGSSEALRQ